MDNINQKYGQDTLQVATNIRYLNKKMPMKKKSPRYTTNWNELKIIE